MSFSKQTLFEWIRWLEYYQHVVLFYSPSVWCFVRALLEYRLYSFTWPNSMSASVYRYSYRRVFTHFPWGPKVLTRFYVEKGAENIDLKFLLTSILKLYFVGFQQQMFTEKVRVCRWFYEQKRFNFDNGKFNLVNTLKFHQALVFKVKF